MNENLVLVTGMSGAGKSSAMNALEDLGYCCIDNFRANCFPSFRSSWKRNRTGTKTSPCLSPRQIIQAL